MTVVLISDFQLHAAHTNIFFKGRCFISSLFCNDSTSDAVLYITMLKIQGTPFVTTCWKLLKMQVLLLTDGCSARLSETNKSVIRKCHSLKYFLWLSSSVSIVGSTGKKNAYEVWHCFRQNCLSGWHCVSLLNFALASIKLHFHHIERSSSLFWLTWVNILQMTAFTTWTLNPLWIILRTDVW